MQPELTPEAFWDYTNNVYSKDDVAAQCLYLQDTAGVNVNLLLLLCWCMHNAWVVTLPQFTVLKEAIRESEDAIARHRLRRKAARPGTDGGDETLYTQLKAEELILEKAQQRLLVAAFNQQTLSHAGSAVNPAIVAFIHLYQLRNSPEAIQVIKNLINQSKT